MKFWFWILIFIFTAVLFFLLLHFGLSLNASNAIGNSILLFTALIVLLYTHETQILRKATIEQTETSIRPQIICKYIGDNKVQCHNIGNGVALNVKIRDLEVEPNKSLVLAFKPVLFLQPGEEQDIEVQDCFSLGDRGLPMAANLDSEYGQSPQILNIDYQDILQNKYSQRMKVGKGEPEVL